jgi:hypothetical protein
MILILLNLLIGIAIVRDYGESWDEQSIYAYANISIHAYPVFFLAHRIPYFGGTVLGDYGPAYSMAQVFLTKVLQAIFPSWSMMDGWHFGYFIAFQIGILSLYFLLRKWIGQWAAIGATLLFSSQPLLWGQAFINPKDIPFMSFFLASITLGISMVDATPRLSIGEHRPAEDHPALKLKEEWAHSSSRTKRAGIAFLIIYGLAIIAILTDSPKILVAKVVTKLYSLDKRSFLGAWFTKHATHANQVPVINYIHKAQTILSWFEIPLILIGLAAVIWIYRKVFPLSFERISKQVVLPFVRGILFNPWVLAAGLLLGITTSIRILGPLAGGIVLVYALYKSWRKAVLLVIPYSLIALLAMYLTWPYLFGNAVNHFIESINVMAHYPWTGLLLFQGKLIAEKYLPKYFIPYMMSIQLTEVMPPLFIIGFIYCAWRAWKGSLQAPFFMIVLWFIIPLIGVMAIGSTVYDNFRQFLFLLPPVFLSAGIALEALFSRIKRDAVKFLILFVLVIPGIYADINLHPYQYIYYNSFVGGVRGAFRNYELDYWGTSYRQAAQYVNATAPLNAEGIVFDPEQTFQDYARPDLKIDTYSEFTRDKHYDFIVILNRKNQDQGFCRSIAPAMTIERDGAILTAIKMPPRSVKGCP